MLCLRRQRYYRLSLKQKVRKIMNIQIKKQKSKKTVIPVGMFCDGDWFKCQNCGYTVRMKVLGNTATCSECGGRMVRI